MGNRVALSFLTVPRLCTVRDENVTRSVARTRAWEEDMVGRVKEKAVVLKQLPGDLHTGDSSDPDIFHEISTKVHSALIIYFTFFPLHKNV